MVLLGLAALPVFTESLQCDLDSQEQELRSYVDLYLVISFISPGLSEERKNTLGARLSET